MSIPRILIVEDEAIIALGIQEDLEKLGYQVVGSAYDGEEALEMVQVQQPDLVLMDINLRGMLDGIETALLINKSRSTPVIFVTAMVDDETVQRAKPCEPYGYIIKPIRQDDLRTTIEHALYKYNAEAKLRQSEARFRSLFETSLDGIVSTDPTGNILDCNPAFCTLLGYSTAELIGKSIAGFTPPEYIPLETQIMKEQVLERGFSNEYQKEYFHKDGSRIPVSLRVWIRKDSQNQSLGYWGIVQDLTETREAERVITRQAENAQDLLELTTLLNSHLDLDDLLELICNQMIQAMNVDVALITFVDTMNDDVTIIHHAGQIQFNELQIPSLELHKQFTEEGQSYLFFYDVQEELTHNPNYPFLAEHDIRSVILVNLTHETRSIGTLDLATIGKSRSFSEDEINFLLTFANQAAISIDRALLYREVCNRADELDILGHLSDRLRAVDHPQEMLSILLNAVMDHGQADAGIVYLLGAASNPIDQFEVSHVTAGAGEWFIPGSLLWATALSTEVPVHVTLNPAFADESTGFRQGEKPFLSALLLSFRSAHALSAIMALGFVNSVKMKPRILQVFSSIAEMGGNALHRSGLVQMLEKRVTDRSSEINTLYDLSIYVNLPITYSEKLNGALQRIIASSGADCGVIYRYDLEKSNLYLEAQQNLPQNSLPDVQEIYMPKELKHWLESSTIPWLANREDGQPSPIVIAGALAFKTVINLPIRYEGRVLGLLCILWKTQPDLSPDNIAHLISLTERVSSAIQNEAFRKKSENAALLEERNRLARELHDSVSQSLYSQSLLAEAAGDLLAHREFSRLESCLKDLKENSTQVLKEMRLLLFELRPPMVGEQDLVNALQNRLEGVERRAGVATQLFINGTVMLPANIQNDLYYITLEALNNSLKHSGANSVRVLIDSNDHELQLTIEDNGKGFKTDQDQSAGLGLTTMQERVSKLGGYLNIISAPGKGTRVAVKLELKKE